MKCVFVVNQLAGGGAERNLVRLANWLSTDHGVTVIVLRSVAHEDISVSKSINLVRMPGTSPGNVFLGACRRLRLRGCIVALKPDVVVCFTFGTNIMCLESLFGTGIPIVVSERNNPHSQKRSRPMRLRQALLYPTAACVVLLANELEEWGRNFFPRWKVVSIDNPVFPPPPPKRLRENDYRVILALGRFVEQKGFDLLLKAFCKITRFHPDWRLVIAGDGPLNDELQTLSKKLGICDRVDFAGWTADPYTLYQEASIFAFPSRFEGFGMTLAEALSCGLPVVAFDCPFGPSRILDHDINGFLVPLGDVSKFAECLDLLMGDEEIRSRFASNGPIVLAKFSPKRIFACWESVLKRVCNL